MSYLNPVFGEYGSTQRGQDYNMFWSKNHATIRFQGHLTTGATNKFLKRVEGTQALYVPPETFGSIRLHGAVVQPGTEDVSFILHDVTTGNTFENDGGTTAVVTTTATVDTDIIVTVVANDTLDCLEVGVLETSGTHDIYVVLDLELFWINDTYKALLGTQLYPLAGTATVAEAE